MSGQCIPLDWQCDGEMDCPDGLDEWDNICSKSTELLPISCCHVLIQISLVLTNVKKKSFDVMQMDPVFLQTGGAMGLLIVSEMLQMKRIAVSILLIFVSTLSLHLHCRGKLYRWRVPM